MEAGHRLELTYRGRVFAVMVPAPDDAWEELIASGQITRAIGTGGELTDERPIKFERVNAVAELIAMRGSAT
jgi:antitoxin (DNA-binding transcriptional repressor) of toxin-antitoxin stability system